MTKRRILPRECVLRALKFEVPGVVPVEYHPSPAGVYDHGERLRALGSEFPDDFNVDAPFPVAGPETRSVNANGVYRERRRDVWGVTWEHLIFGIAGHPVERPLDDWAALETYQGPEPPVPGGESQEAVRHRASHYLKSGWISIFETMHAVRRFEDVLMDLAEDRQEIHRLADLITEYRLAEIRHLLARGVDAIQFGDDFGTQSGLMISPKCFRRFFLPRYRRLVEPVLASGKQVFFHTCGRNLAILDDLAELGVHAVWPQLNAYDLEVLARWSRERRVAVAIHPDRGELMTRGTPDAVRAEVERLYDLFRVPEGGSWFYVEIDAGFPFENVEALIRTIGQWR